MKEVGGKERDGFCDLPAEGTLVSDCYRRWWCVMVVKEQRKVMVVVVSFTKLRGSLILTQVMSVMGISDKGQW